MNFTIGSKIVCVDASPPPADHSTCGPELERGKVYCVTEVDPPWSARDPGGVRIIGPLCFTAAGDESWWRADRFRRLEDVQAQKGTNIPYVLYEPPPVLVNGLWYKARIVAYPPLKPREV